MTHLPMFTMKVHRKQVIITGDLPADILAQYQDLRAKNPDQFFLLGNANPDYLDNLIKDGNSFEAVLDMGFPVEGEPHLLSGFKLENIHAIVVESLEANDLDTSYPNLMPFYLYGTPDQVHIDHVLRAYPNIQLASNNVKLDIDKPLSTKQLYNGVVAVFKTVFENYMQPMRVTSTYFKVEHKTNYFSEPRKIIIRLSYLHLVLHQEASSPLMSTRLTRTLKPAVQSVREHSPWSKVCTWTQILSTWTRHQRRWSNPAKLTTPPHYHVLINQCTSFRT